MTLKTAYCTIVAKNYLPKAMALQASLLRHEPDASLLVVVTDARSDADLPPADGLELASTAFLGLPERTVLDLAMAYDLVELATAIKPLILRKLLRGADRAVYLDPDLYLASPMAELPDALAASEGGIVLTPHFLVPAGSGQHFSEGHLLSVGVYNLGFCAVDRRASGFLDWWWGHLQDQCLHDPLAGLFVDQKWMDVGSVLFRAAPLRHAGYNVSIANLHERPLASDADGYYIASTGDRLRVFHFHAFSASEPDELSTRARGLPLDAATDPAAIKSLCTEYATLVLDNERLAGPPPPYGYATDTTGRRITRRLRRAYRMAGPDGMPGLPSPFLPEDAARYERWRRAAWKLVGRQLLGDGAKSVRYALPEEYENFKRRFPRLASGARERFVEQTGFWG